MTKSRVSVGQPWQRLRCWKFSTGRSSAIRGRGTFEKCMLKQFSLFKLCQPTTCILAQQRRNIIRLGCFAVILYQGNPKPLKRQVHRKKTGFYHVLSKNRGFLNSKISVSALSHKVLPLMLKNQQCSYQHAASGLVSCRARDFVGKLFLHFSNVCPTTFHRRNAPTNNVIFCIPGAYTTTWIVYLQNNISRWASDPFFSWNLSAQRPSVGLKTLAYGPDPKHPYFFNGFPRVNCVFFFLRVKYGFLKAGVLFKIRKYGFSTG